MMQERPSNSAAETGESESPLQQAQRAMAKGDLERVETLVDHAVQSGRPHPAERRLWVQVAFRQGRLNIALRRSVVALKAQPNDPHLHVLTARVQAAAGMPRQALRRINRIIPRWPDRYKLRLVKFQLLRDLNRTRPALRELQKLRRHWFDMLDVQLAAVQFYRAHGRLRAARAVLDHLLEHHPNHRQARIIRQQLVSAGTVQDTASSLPELLTQAKCNPAASTAYAAEILQAVKLATTPELVSTCREAIEFLGDMADQLMEHDKLVLFNQAERFGYLEIANRALTKVLDGGPRDVHIARILFNKAMTSVEPHQADAVVSRLLKHIPEARQAPLAQSSHYGSKGHRVLLNDYVKINAVAARCRRSIHSSVSSGLTACMALGYDIFASVVNAGQTMRSYAFSKPDYRWIQGTPRKRSRHWKLPFPMPSEFPLLDFASSIFSKPGRKMLPRKSSTRPMLIVFRAVFLIYAYERSFYMGKSRKQ